MMYSLFVRNIILPLSDKILGLSLSKELKKWRKIQWYSKDELEQMQLSGLKNILNHSHKNIPYYKDIFQKVGYNENMDAPVVELKKMPFLTKKIIKKNLPDQILDKNRETYFIDHTSGSSGVQGQFHYDKEAYSKTLAVQSLWWEWSGYKLGDKAIQTGMTPDRGLIKGIKDKLFRVKYTQAFQMDSRTTQKNLQPIRGTKDYYFMGYASSLYSYAKFAEELGIDDIHFKAVVSWGDKMFPHYRKLIEKQFQAEVFDTYGASEGTMIAAECEEHNYHIMTPHVFIELLDKDGKEVSPGELGEIVVTRLDNFRMPLIRYRIGDLAIKADPEKKCACGRNFPMLEKIIGRVTDIIYTPKGRAVIVHFFTGIFEHIPQIEQFQVEQKEDFPLIIRYIPDKDFNRDLLDDIKQEIYKKAGEVFPVEFTRVDEIKPTPSGKPQIVISA